jgi:hypothetical protein
MTARDFSVMYRPNFCAECGVQIERRQWRLWTSRRFFCAQCAGQHRKAEIMLATAVGAALFVAGVVAGRFTGHDPPPLVIEREAATPTPLITGGSAMNLPLPSAHDNIAGSAAIQQPVYICGARTKKGTPCSRRVHVPERCWQHKGLPAMLPPEKLVISAASSGQ